MIGHSQLSLPLQQSVLAPVCSVNRPPAKHTKTGHLLSAKHRRWAAAAPLRHSFQLYAAADPSKAAFREPGEILHTSDYFAQNLSSDASACSTSLLPFSVPFIHMQEHCQSKILRLWHPLWQRAVISTRASWEKSQPTPSMPAVRRGR